jgi:Yip1-like protein
MVQMKERTMNLVERVKEILVSPKTEWTVIDGESGDATYLFTNYVAILAAVPAVASFLGFSFIGLPIGRTLLFAIFLYVFYCVAWYVEAYIIDALAPTFGGQKNLASALKVSAYSSTAVWLAGIFNLIPVFGILTILGLYSLYLLWTGLPVLMKSPQDRATTYTVAVVVIMIVIMIVVMLLLASLLRPY